jgi:hypothetical protein
MALCDYPIDLRVDYPERSSRGWAVLTIILLKFFALIPHGVILLFLGIGQMVVAFVAQVAVAIKGEYPPGMFSFVTGVLRWSTRVSAFLFSLTDRYPPFALQPDESYPVDVVVERPARQSRLYAAFTVLVEILFVVALVGLVIWLARNADSILNDTSPTSIVNASEGSGTTYDTNPGLNFSPQSWMSGGLLLRQLAALPHYIVLVALGIVSLLIFLIVQWIILFTAAYPRGMFDLVVGITRWQTRVSGYAFGLSDRYPPFALEPSIATPVPVTAPPQWYADPKGRHAYRYWDGAQWTPHVADEGGTSYDPLDSYGP